MKARIIIALLLLPAFSFCQKHINQTHAAVMADLKKYKAGSIKPVFTETDSTITMSVKGGDVKAMDFIYAFDKSGKCNSEKTMANCDSCVNKMLQEIVNNKKFGWRQINENQYVSKFEDHLMIELPVNPNEFSYTILRMDWTRASYDLITNK